MALTSSETRPTSLRPPDILEDYGCWLVVESSRTVSLSPDDLDRLFTDCPTWGLWDPGIDAVTLEEGPRGEPGMLCRMMVGTRRLRMPFHYVLVGHTKSETTIYTGGWSKGRLIDVVDIRPRRSSSEVVRRLEIRLSGPWRHLRPLVRRLARRHLRRSLDALA